MNGAIPWWVTILVLLRDVMIIAIVLVVVLTTSVRSFPPSLLGKANTVVQFTTLLTVLLNNVIQSGWLQGVITALVAMTAVTTVFSAVHYALEVSRRLYAHPSAGEGE